MQAGMAPRVLASREQQQQHHQQQQQQQQWQWQWQQPSLRRRHRVVTAGARGAATLRIGLLSIFLSLVRPGDAILVRQGAGNGANLTRAQAAAGVPIIDELRRPGGHGNPTIVKFGIYVKKVYSVDAKDRSFTADIIFTYMWKDPGAAARVLGDGTGNVELSDAKARTMLWLPDMTVSNRGTKAEVISSTCIVQDDGDVIQVIRLVVTILSKFNMEHFPFDTQELTVELASSTYMLDEVILEPMGTDPTVGSQGARSKQHDDPSIAERFLPPLPPRIFGGGKNANASSKTDGADQGAGAVDDDNGTLDVNNGGTNLTGFVNYATLARASTLYGVAPGIFDDKEYALVDVYMSGYETADSVLRKSRGKLGFILKHRPFSFLISSYLPVLLLQVVATASFFFPMAAQFAMPRTATILVSQLAAISFSVRIATAHPSDNELAWIEIFISTVQLQMFLVMCLNMCCEHLAHNLKAPVQAMRTNEECKVVVLTTTFISNLLLFLHPAFETTESTMSQIIIAAVTIGYGSLFVRIAYMVNKDKDKEEEAIERTLPS